MPDRVGGIIQKFLEDVKQNVKDNYPLKRRKGTEEFELNISKEISQAKSELLKVVLECVPKEKQGSPIDIRDNWIYDDGFNACRSQVIEAMERLFGKEIV